MSGSSETELVECYRDERLQVDRYEILDTPREAAFDRVAHLIRTIFDLPIAIVSMIDATGIGRQRGGA